MLQQPAVQILPWQMHTGMHWIVAPAVHFQATVRDCCTSQHARSALTPPQIITLSARALLPTVKVSHQGVVANRSCAASKTLKLAHRMGAVVGE
jgi:transposase InsO family protein